MNFGIMFIASLLVFALSSVNAGELTIMSYNAENLFDAQHDEGKNDWEYLPKDFPGKEENCLKITNQRYRQKCLESDWNEGLMLKKMNALKEVIVGPNGKLPDLLALQEVENDNVVAKFAEVLGYKNHLVTNSPDKRGIDVALLYNEGKELEYHNHKELTLKGKLFADKPTRNILQVHMHIGGKPVTVFVNHWPSQANPSEARLAAAKKMKKAMMLRKLMNRKEHFIALGDFNVISEDNPHPFKEKVEKGILKMTDVQTAFNEHDGSRKLRGTMPLSTYFYIRNMSWNKLDRIFVSKNLLDEKEMEVDLLSFKIHSTKNSAMNFTYNREGEYNSGTTIVGIPKRFDSKAEEGAPSGASDHFPVSVKLKY